jgi:predicted dehydrogenase
MRVLIVGLGSIGARHLKNIKFTFPDAEFYVLRSNNASVETEKKNIADDFIPPYTTISEWSEIHALYPDYAVICTPSFLHAKNILEVYNRTNAVILVEKPCAVNIDQVKSLSVIADSKRVFITQQLRFHPISSYLKNLVIKKTLGSCYRFRMVHSEHVALWHPWENYKNSYVVNSKMGGGSFLTQNHELDLSVYLFGMPDRQVSLVGSGGHLGIDCDEMSSTLMHYFFDGLQLIGEISTDLLGRDPKKIGEFHFEMGSIYVDFINNTVDLKSHIEPVPIEARYMDLEFDKNLPYLKMVGALLSNNDQLMDPRIVSLGESLDISRKAFSSVIY